MTTPTSPTNIPAVKKLRKRAFEGAGLALLLTSLFLGPAFYTNNVLHGKHFGEIAWEFLPLFTSTAAGFLGGMIYYVVIDEWSPRGWSRIVAIFLVSLVYVVVVWLSLIIGLHATGKWH